MYLVGDRQARVRCCEVSLPVLFVGDRVGPTVEDSPEQRCPVRQGFSLLTHVSCTSGDSEYMWDVGCRAGFPLCREYLGSRVVNMEEVVRKPEVTRPGAEGKALLT